MSVLADNTVTRVNVEDVEESISFSSSACSVHDGSQNEQDKSDSYLDSGVALNFSAGFKRSLKQNRQGTDRDGLGLSEVSQATGLNFSLKTKPNGGQQPGTPMSEFRRASIAEMINSGGLFINQCGTYEFDLDATDLEQLYAEANASGRRPSYSASTGYGSGPVKEEQLNPSLSQKFSMGASSEDMSFASKDFGTTYWWSPKFKSEVLQNQLRRTVIEFLRTRFRVALVFIGIFTLVWIVVFSVSIPFNFEGVQDVGLLTNQLALYSVRYTPWYVIGGAVLFFCVGVLLVTTFTKLYAKYAILLSLFLAIILMFCSFALAVDLKFNNGVQGFWTMSFVAQFAVTAVFILSVFTLSRLPIWLSVVLSVIYLVILETLIGVFIVGLKSVVTISLRTYFSSAAARVLLYICLMLSGATTAYLSQVRQVATFWKIAQCVLSLKALDLERELEEKTILSMMPKLFADGLLNINVQMMFMIKQSLVHENGCQDPIYQSFSAPFSMCSMDNVSILFADIVDFTSFSSTLSAAELVGILNDVFSTFDDLVTRHNCEKISTLGDCYFCVSGCPEPEAGHADNCVNMGLAIIKALEEYRERTPWPIQMRVGIHTGSVFCGVMGTKRFKFDVWSRDVRIANQIESVGTPGRVIISSKTNSCLSGSYVIEPAIPQRSEPELDGTSLYYVTGHKTRMQGSGISGSEWKKKINNIDTVCKPDINKDSQSRTMRESLTSAAAKCCPFLCWNRTSNSTPTQKSLAEGCSSSIVDIQTQLQRCTSYADLTVPQSEEEKKNVDIDKDIVNYMEEHKVHFDTYFDPKLHLITLAFHDHDWESTYRKYGRDLDDGLNGELTEMELCYRITKLSYMLDTVALFISFILIMIGSAICLSSDDTFSSIWPAWLGIFLLGLLVEVAILILVLAVFSPQRFPKWFAQFASNIINYYVRSIVALFFIYYPITVACVSMVHCQTFGSSSSELAGLAHVQLTFFITIVVLMSSITFMEVSHIVKFVGGFLVGALAIVMVVVVRLSQCIENLPVPTERPLNATTTTHRVRIITMVRIIPTITPDSYLTNYYTRHIAPEAVIVILLVLILLTLVNRMSEVSVRLSFIARIEASARRRLTRQRKVQAEWLLFNIIPPNVAFKLRTTGKFSQNHECVGVMFASIVNFQRYLQNENQGEESLRLLNSIISEFDMLLERQDFDYLEKIKTIGSTYMAASGLNTSKDSDPVPHLLQLINFGHQLMNVLQFLNQRLPDFKLEMHVGFNYGPVTSGVVGSRKMLYDIWGDTVNVASRMASTGSTNQIQMPQDCLSNLGPHVNHTAHSVINVKGKGEMRTVFIIQSNSHT